MGRSAAARRVTRFGSFLDTECGSLYGFALPFSTRCHFDAGIYGAIRNDQGIRTDSTSVLPGCSPSVGSSRCACTGQPQWSARRRRGPGAEPSCPQACHPPTPLPRWRPLQECATRLAPPWSPSKRLANPRVRDRRADLVLPITVALAGRFFTREGASAQGISSTTALERTPMPDTSTSTVSPGTSHFGGSKRAPAPLGVPVRITSPGSSVVKVER